MNVAINGGTRFVGSHIIDASHRAGHSSSLLVRPGSEYKLVDVEGSRQTIGDLLAADADRAYTGRCDVMDSGDPQPSLAVPRATRKHMRHYTKTRGFDLVSIVESNVTGTNRDE